MADAGCPRPTWRSGSARSRRARERLGEPGLRIPGDTALLPAGTGRIRIFGGAGDCQVVRPIERPREAVVRVDAPALLVARALRSAYVDRGEAERR